MKSLQLFGLIALVAATLHGQTFWSTSSSLDCSSLGENAYGPYTTPTGVQGYSCFVGGTFAWYASGGAWSTAIRVAAPASGAVLVDYLFYDKQGNPVNMDSAYGSGPANASGNEVTFALYANQPREVDLLGATGNGPGYSTLTDGSVYGTFLCPDATTCMNVQAQLLYSALPAIPWALSVPIAWDNEESLQWSAEGIDDGNVHRVSLAIYNDDVVSTTPTTFTVQVFDSNGNLAGTGVTPAIPPIPTFSDGSYGEGGTYAVALSDLISPLPSGIFKVLIDGGSVYSAVVVLQMNGQSATSMQVAYDTAAGSSVTTSVRRANARTAARVASRLKPMLAALAK